MLKNTVLHQDLRYLYNKPKKLYWKIVASAPMAKLSSLQEYDLIYDIKDLKIRKMDTEANLKQMQKKVG